MHEAESQGPHDVLGLKFWPKVIFLGLWKTPGFFWVTNKTEGFFLGCKKQRDFLGCKKRTKGFFGYAKKVVIFGGRQILSCDFLGV